jgi:16S rRNA (cytidine1402-2'-O)-methyltransferase
MIGNVYLIPIALSEDGYHTLPAYIAEKINACDVFFAENIRTARRAFKKIDKQFNIDSKEWHEIEAKEIASVAAFKSCLIQQKNIGIVSESGCPGIADPGQKLVAVAQEMGATVNPISGPSSILLSLMASGLNGQSFTFNGYLPIESGDREKKIKELEKKAIIDKCTQLFIETPYRNNVMLTSLLKVCHPSTKLCIAYNLTSSTEWIKTKKISDWKENTPTLPKEPAIFLIGD